MTAIKAIRKLTTDTNIIYGDYLCTIDSVATDYIKMTAWLSPVKTFEITLPTKKVDSLLTRKLITIKN